MLYRLHCYTKNHKNMENGSINNQLKSARILVQNAEQHPTIKQQLAAWGYAAPQMARGKALLNNTQLAQQAQKDAYHIKLDCDRQWKADWTTFQKQYSEHRAVAKAAYRRESNTLQRLRLDRPIPQRMADLLDQATDFYAALSAKGKEVQKFGIQSEEVAQAGAMVSSLADQQAQRMQCKGTAESATQKRNQALTELGQWQREFVRVARMALKEDTQLLESLGIVVAA